jgi:outer membrane receptor protein involved in Fe transport
VEATAGNYGELGGSASINGPIAGDVLAGRLYVAKRSRDGFVDIVDETGTRSSHDDMDRDYYTTRGQLLWRATDALSINLSADYSKRDENCCAAVQVINTSVPQVTNALSAIVPNSYANPADPFERNAHLNRDTTQELTDKGAAIDVDWDLHALGDARLTSITAVRRWDMNNGQDSDYTNVDILYRDDAGRFGSTFDQKSEELRLAGTSGKLDWLVGAFYAKEDMEYRNQLLLGNDFQRYLGRLLGNPNAITLLTGNPSAFPGGQGQEDVFKQESSSWALFTNETLHVTDSLHLTLGVRYTDESKDLDSQYRNDHNGVGCQALRTNAALIQGALTAQLAALPASQRAAAITQALQTIYGIGCAGFADPIFNNLATSQSIDESEWSGTVKLAYDINSHLMSYLSYARGYKASGFNMDRERDNAVVHESATVPLNLANSPLNPAGAIIAKTDTSFDDELVDSYELGAKSQWLDNSLSVNGAVFYQDYKDFQLNTFTGLQFVVTSVPKVVSQGVDVDVLWAPISSLSLQGGVTYADTTIEEFGAAARFFRPERENDTLSFAPKWSASLAAMFEHNLGSSLLYSASVGAKYSSKYNTGSNLDPRKQQDAYTLINARVGFGAADRSWVVEAWVQNLTDKDYVQVAFDGTLQGSAATPAGTLPTSTIDGYLGLPRTYGLTARVRF